MVTARHAWLGILAIAGAWDYFKRGDQLTDEMRRWTRMHPVVMRLALYTMAAHLAHDLPRQLDWVSGLGWVASRLRLG